MSTRRHRTGPVRLHDSHQRRHFAGEVDVSVSHRLPLTRDPANQSKESDVSTHAEPIRLTLYYSKRQSRKTRLDSRL